MSRARARRYERRCRRHEARCAAIGGTAGSRYLPGARTLLDELADFNRTLRRAAEEHARRMHQEMLMYGSSYLQLSDREDALLRAHLALAKREEPHA